MGGGVRRINGELEYLESEYAVVRTLRGEGGGVKYLMKVVVSYYSSYVFQ